MKGERAGEEIVVIVAGAAATREGGSGLAAACECFSEEREAGIGPSWTVFVDSSGGGEEGVQDRGWGGTVDESPDEGFGSRAQEGGTGFERGAHFED